MTNVNIRKVGNGYIVNEIDLCVHPTTVHKTFEEVVDTLRNIFNVDVE